MVFRDSEIVEGPRQGLKDRRASKIEDASSYALAFRSRLESKNPLMGSNPNGLKEGSNPFWVTGNLTGLFWAVGGYGSFQYKGGSQFGGKYR